MSSLQFPPTLDALRSELSELPDWDERYEFLIDLGRQLPPLSAEQQTPANLVHGCMSTVWLEAQFHGNAPHRQMVINADSDSLIVKGLIVLLLAIFDRHTCREVLTIDPAEIFKELGLHQHLSPQRRNGLFAMVKRIKQLAATACAANE